MVKNIGTHCICDQSDSGSSPVMAIVVPFEIAYEIAQHAYYMDRVVSRYLLRVLGLAWKKILPQLKGTSQSFRYATDAILFREVTVTQMDLRSIAKMDILLKSPSICSSIREYKFSPSVYPAFSPYSPDRPRGYFRPRKTPRFNESHRWEFGYVHEGQQLLREQLEIMNFSKSELKEVQHEPYSPLRSRLMSLPYLGIITQLSNLRSLHITYNPEVINQNDPFHYRLKDDISEGLGSLLVASLLRLDHFTLLCPTLTDIERIVDSMSRAQMGQCTHVSSKIRILHISLSKETLSHKGREIDLLFKVHAHLNGGKPLQELLKFLPEIEELTLMFCTTGGVNNTLLLQHFDPPPLERLRKLTLFNLGFTSDAFKRLTSKTSFFRSRIFGNLVLCDKNASWVDCIRAWLPDSLCGSDTSIPLHLFIHCKLGYLNHEVCDEKALETLAQLDGKTLKDMTTVDWKMIALIEQG